jgi:DNA repair protein RecO (recombination protein O)
MTHKTKGIVLKTTKYGETSLVVTIFTELFGVQTYMVNGVRTSKPSASKANHFQPAALLDMVVYHQEQKNIQRIKEFKFDFLYHQVLTNVIKNSIAVFMIELLYKCLKQPEANPDLFNFCEDALKQLDIAAKPVAANFALFFSLHLTHFFGFRMNDDYSAENCFLDLEGGGYCTHQPAHPHFVEGENARITSQLLKTMQPRELGELKLHHETRRQLLSAYQDYYALHIQDFGQMKTLRVLAEVL